jgi:hypothetical protein
MGKVNGFSREGREKTVKTVREMPRDLTLLRLRGER